jgi:hypothetical protein
MSANALTLKLNGTPVLLGTIVATTTSRNNNDSTGMTAFNNTGDALKGKTLLLIPDASCFIKFGNANNVVATSAGIPVNANERITLSMHQDYGWVAAIVASGTVNLRVWELI